MPSVRSLPYWLVLTAVLACGGDNPDPSGPNPPPAVETVTVSPTTETLVPQQTRQFSASAQSASGAPVSNVTFTWSTSPGTRASVSNGGVVTALSPGEVTVTASASGRSGNATVTVREGGFVTASGGTVSAYGGAVSIVVPAGAVTAGTALTVDPAASPPADPALVPGTAWTLGPDGAAFTIPVTVRLRYPDPLPGDVTPDRLVVHRWNGSAWQPLGATAQDETARTVSGQTSGFSTFALLAVAPPDPNPVPVLGEIDPAERNAGDPGFTLQVAGTGFLAGSVVHFGGDPRPTTFVSEQRLDAEIPASDLLTAGQVSVTVVNPPPGGGTSNAIAFTIRPASLNDGARIAAGDDHTCALTGTGRALCWGDGELGQVGDGSPAFLPHPVAVLGGVSFATVDPGSQFTCGVDVQGHGHCWGSGSGGRLGNGSMTHQFSPTQVGGGLTFTTIEAHANHACGLTPEGAAYCWGAGLDGQLGDGVGPATRSQPVAVLGGLVFEQLAIGLSHSCGLTADGEAWCWGGNGSGQLGIGSNAASFVPARVSGGQTFRAITSGNAHVCALSAQGVAWCWGSNVVGALGNGTNTSSTTPVAVAGGLTFAAVAAGGNHTCALTESGAAHCWGRNFWGAVGDGSTTSKNAPVAVQGGHALSNLAAGNDFTCGVTTEGQGLCWGLNDTGQLGDGTTENRSVPTVVAGGHDFVAIRPGDDRHTCAVTGAGAAWCWGRTVHGQLGDGTRVLHTTPAEVAGGHTFTDITAGDDHSCGVVSGGTAYCWGNGTRGELGNGGTDDHGVPTPVAGGLSFDRIDAGHRYTCGVTVQGQAYCWGLNAFGPLGNGQSGNDDTRELNPVLVLGGHTFTKVSTGVNHTCGLRTDGAVLCWGFGASGQIGHGGGTSTTPAVVSGNHTFVDVAAGHDFACAVTEAGQVLCWGEGAGGRLGTGNETDQSTPTPVVSDLTFHAVTAGGIGTRGFACALSDDDRALCWGSGGVGSLGTGGLTNRLVPTEVVGGHRFQHVSAGFQHTCGVTLEGGMYCWGNGSNGQLGDGATSIRTTPVAVVEP